MYYRNLLKFIFFYFIQTQDNVNHTNYLTLALCYQSRLDQLLFKYTHKLFPYVYNG